MPKDKREPNFVKSINLPTRMTPVQFEMFQKLFEKAGNMKAAEFRRQMLTKGFVQAVPERKDMEELRELRRLLIEYKTNFNRISNLIQSYDPNLAIEIRQLVKDLQDRIKSL